MKRKSPRPPRFNQESRDEAKFRVTGEDLEARRAQRLCTSALLKTGRTPLQVVQIGVEAERIAGEALAAAVQRQPPQRPLACAAGCAWCCHKRVGVAVPEVIRIADYLRAVLTPPQMQALLERIEQTLEKRRQRAPNPQPCPLLVDNRCAAYAVRPLTCRGFNSSDAGLCQASIMENARATVPVYPPQLRLMTLVLDGMRSGLAESGLKNELLELTAALAIALKVEDAADEWLQGRPVFASAGLP
jgi:Fe-S-cluster containining protein